MFQKCFWREGLLVQSSKISGMKHKCISFGQNLIIQERSDDEGTNICVTNTGGL